MKTRLYEDNGGGLHWVTEDGRSNSTNGVHPGHNMAGRLLADLEDAPGWIDPGELTGVAFEGGAGLTLIAECDGGTIAVHVGAMGASGRAYAGLD